MQRYSSVILAVALAFLLLAVSVCAADLPKPTKKNTISIELTAPVKPQRFSEPVRFFLVDVIDRSGDPLPMLLYEGRGGIFLDREPREIVREALARCLQEAGLLADQQAEADYLLTVYLFHFGLAPATGMEYFSKVDLNVMVTNTHTGKFAEVTALGTSVEGTAILKRNMKKNLKANLESALQRALRSFLRGRKLREALEMSAGTGS